MKRLLVLTLLLATPVYAVPGWLIGFGVGVTVQIIPFTRNHIILPPLKTLQRTIRPIPQDKVDKANRKAAKEKKKLEREQRKRHSQCRQ